MTHRYTLAAWTLVTPGVQADLDASETAVAAQRLRELATSLVAATGCAPETARRQITRALHRRRGDRIRAAEANRRMTLAEASELFAVDHDTLRRAAIDQRLPAEKSSHTWLVWLNDVREFADAITPRHRD